MPPVEVVPEVKPVVVEEEDSKLGNGAIIGIAVGSSMCAVFSIVCCMCVTTICLRRCVRALLRKKTARPIAKNDNQMNDEEKHLRN